MIKTYPTWWKSNLLLWTNRNNTDNTLMLSAVLNQAMITKHSFYDMLSTKHSFYDMLSTKHSFYDMLSTKHSFYDSISTKHSFYDSISTKNSFDTQLDCLVGDYLQQQVFSSSFSPYFGLLMLTDLTHNKQYCMETGNQWIFEKEIYDNSSVGRMCVFKTLLNLVPCFFLLKTIILIKSWG